LIPGGSVSAPGAAVGVGAVSSAGAIGSGSARPGLRGIYSKNTDLVSYDRICVVKLKEKRFNLFGTTQILSRTTKNCVSCKQTFT
jgi:hypothetical protein